ncbi:hypothetical protein [Gloeothece verrucosa]|nr:hypothetical protein [Gloeothece verrucosa]
MSNLSPHSLPMSRRNSSSRSPSPKNQPKEAPRRHEVDFEILQELERLQEIIMTESSQIPFTRLRLINEDKLLDQIEMICDSLPESIKKAQALLEQEEEIILEAQDYAKQIVQSAQQRAAQILDETGIIQQAERQASQIRQQVQQECEEVQEKTITEIEQMRRTAEQELQQIRQQALAECHDIEDGAFDYADNIFSNLEQQLAEMLTIVRKGRQQMNQKASPTGAVSPELPLKKMPGPGNPGKRP